RVVKDALVRHRAHDREQMRGAGQPRQVFDEVHTGDVGGGRSEGPPHLRRRAGLEIPNIELTGSPLKHEQHTRPCGRHPAAGMRPTNERGKRQSDKTQASQAEPAAARQVEGQVHGSIPDIAGYAVTPEAAGATGPGDISDPRRPYPRVPGCTSCYTVA